MNEKQQQLTFDKGITNVPSDAICSDNALAESVGMVYDDGEHRVIQKPKPFITTVSGGLGAVPKVHYVHRSGNMERYIASDSSNNFNWGTVSNGNFALGGVLLDVNGNRLIYSSGTQITSVGNTLIVKKADGEIYYFLWTKNTYKTLGNKIPDVSVTFSLDQFSDDIFGTTKFVDLEGLLDGTEVYVWPLVGGYEYLKANTIKNDKEEDVKAALAGLVSMRLAKVRENKRFAFPFWARYAMRLYDGSYTNISNPVLLLPTVRNNWHIFTCDDNGNEKPMNGGTNGGWAQTNYKPLYARLAYSISLNGINASAWSDIIAGIDIFISEEVKTFDMEGQWTPQNALTVNGSIRDGVTNTVNPLFTNEQNENLRHYMIDSCRPLYGHYNQIPCWDPTKTGNDRAAMCKCYYQPTLLTDDEIIDKLVNTTNFYKAAEHNLAAGSHTSDEFHRGVLSNLTTQIRLEHDDYYSRAGIKGGVIKSYNHRLHVGNVRRGFFDGFSHFSYTAYLGNPGARTYTYCVYIGTESGERIVEASRGSCLEIAEVWFYYPDKRAKRVDVYLGNQLKASIPLREHPTLNGAYAFTKLPDEKDTVQLPSGTSIPTEYKADEYLEDHVFVSEVDNPWVFLASGDVTTKMGKVIGMAAQVMSLGEMEHGIHPMAVFGTRGISMLRLKGDGTYERSDEISREAALENNPCITETDGVVFFASKRGLMMLAGNTVKCVSEQLSGKTDTFSSVTDIGNFKEFLENAFIAYDYRDALLWIFNSSYTVCWIYSIRSGTFAKYEFGDGYGITNITNNYPDYLIQGAVGSIYSLVNRLDINKDTSTYSCKLLSRPMKFENALALKSLIQVRNIYTLSEGASIGLKIYVSNNLHTWMEVHSLRGMPWKYYRFEYNFERMKAVDRFAGAVIVTSERRTNKLR